MHRSPTLFCHISSIVVNGSLNPRRHNKDSRTGSSNIFCMCTSLQFVSTVTAGKVADVHRASDCTGGLHKVTALSGGLAGGDGQIVPCSNPELSAAASSGRNRPPPTSSESMLMTWCTQWDYMEAENGYRYAYIFSSYKRTFALNIVVSITKFPFTTLLRVTIAYQ